MKESRIFDKIGLTGQQVGFLLLSNLFYTLGLNLFYVGNEIAAGGFAGIGTVLNYFMNIPIGVTVLVLNIPILVWGISIKGKKYIIVTLVAVIIYSLLIDGLSFLPCLTYDKIVAVICGALLYGVAAYFSARANISVGGTDLLAKLLLTKFKFLSLGQMYVILDGTIVVLAMIVYKNIEAGIYALLAIAIAALVTDKLNNGFNSASIFYIFANKNVDKISEAIIHDMSRSATLLTGQGMYSSSHKEILFVVVKPAEIPILKAIVREYDDTAFIVLSTASEIVGSGFECIDLTASIQDDNPIPKNIKKGKNAKNAVKKEN